MPDKRTVLHAPEKPLRPLLPGRPDSLGLGSPSENPIRSITPPTTSAAIMTNLTVSGPEGAVSRTYVGIPPGVVIDPKKEELLGNAAAIMDIKDSGIPEARADFVGGVLQNKHAAALSDDQLIPASVIDEFAARSNEWKIESDTSEPVSRSEIEQIIGRTFEVTPDGWPRLTVSESKVVRGALSIRQTLRENPTLSDADKAAILKRIRRMRFEEKTIAGRLEKLEAEAAYLSRLVGVIKDLAPLLEREPRLGRCDGSQFHKLQEATRALEIVAPCSTTRPGDEPIIGQTFDDEHQIFIVQHDWASAFSKATDFDGGEVRLPYPSCAFEFVINGLRVVISIERDSGMTIVSIKTSAAWSILMSYDWNGRTFTCHAPTEPHADETHQEANFRAEVIRDFQKVMDLCGRQIYAMLVALSAKVATTEIVRVDYKLNRARERRGQLPIFDHHVVCLARRTRVANPLPPDPDREIVRRRLHFRRGHDRHYPKYKIWIDWQLVGDPDLGFIDKEYRL